LNVSLVDAGPAIDLVRALTADGDHFNNSGHLDYMGAIRAQSGL
jgi:hypothetical protein